MKITINSQAIQVDGRPTLLEIARGNNISIPSLCDHPELKPFTGCRLCLVAIKGRKDFAPACGTYPEDGMEVTTESPELTELRRGILELILSEHPFACLVCPEKPSCEDPKSTIRKVGEVTGCVLCPQNSRCDLQRTVEDLQIERVGHPALYKNLDVRREDPFFDRDPNTCILCGKCIRICEEVRGASVLAFVFRGNRTVVGTALDRPLLDSGCQFCGACVDVCPTASLVERAVRPQLLPENFAESVCPFCSQGCELEMGIEKSRVLFSRPSPDGRVNRGQACIRGRFLVRDTLDGAKRIREPWVRKEGALVAANWEEALELTVSRLKACESGRAGVGFGRQVALEDAYLLYKFTGEVLKSDPVFTTAAVPIWDGLARLMDAHGTDLPLNGRIDAVSEADALLVLGADLPAAHPMVWLQVVKAIDRGSRLVVAGSGPKASARHASVFLKNRPGTEHVLAVSLSLEMIRLGRVPQDVPGMKDFRKQAEAVLPKGALEKAGVDGAEIEAAAAILAGAKSPLILIDQTIARGPGGALNLAAAWNLALLSGARLFPLGSGSNDRGLFELARALSSKKPTDSGRTLLERLRAKEISVLYLAGAAVELNGNRPEFLVCQDTHWNPLAASADVVLPAAAFGEAEGTFVNTEGRIQAATAFIAPPGTAKPDREIVAALARKLGAEGFEFENPAAILREMGARVPALADAGSLAGTQGVTAFVREEPPRAQKIIPLEPPSGFPGCDPKHPYTLSVRASGDVYRNYDLAGGIVGLGRLRAPGRVFLHPADMERIGVKEGGDVEILSPAGRLEGRARAAEAVAEGTAETELSGTEPGALEFLGRGIVPAEIRRKS